MALQTFPIALSDLFEGLPIQTTAPDLGEALEMSQTGGGEIITADFGPRLWKMDVTIRLGYYAEIERIKAKLNLLRHAGRSMLAHSMPLVAPQYDPTGAILGASAVTLSNVHANNRQVSLSGLPVGYQLKQGDFFSYTYGSNPTRYAMHQVAEDKTAVAGVITDIEVTTFIRAGYTLGASVRLIKPQFKAVMVPGSFSAGVSGQLITNGVKFSLTQTLR